MPRCPAVLHHISIVPQIGGSVLFCLSPSYFHWSSDWRICVMQLSIPPSTANGSSLASFSTWRFILKFAARWQHWIHQVGLKFGSLKLKNVFIGPNLIILTLWGRVTHICVSKLTIIGSDNGLLPGPHQAIIWTNGWILLIGPLGTNVNEIVIEIYIFPFKKMHLKMSSGKWRPSCLGLKVLSTLSPNQNWLVFCRWYFQMNCIFFHKNIIKKKWYVDWQ